VRLNNRYILRLDMNIPYCRTSISRVCFCVAQARATNAAVTTPVGKNERMAWLAAMVITTSLHPVPRGVAFFLTGTLSTVEERKMRMKQRGDRVPRNNNKSV